jgi:hypothetical protein
MEDPTIPVIISKDISTHIPTNHNVSFLVLLSDNIRVLQKIETEKVITEESDDMYILAVVNTSKTKFDMIKASSTSLHKMFLYIKGNIIKNFDTDNCKVNRKIF